MPKTIMSLMHEFAEAHRQVNKFMQRYITCSCGNELWDDDIIECACGEHVCSQCQKACLNCGEKGCKDCLVESEGWVDYFCKDNCEEEYEQKEQENGQAD